MGRAAGSTPRTATGRITSHPTRFARLRARRRTDPCIPVRQVRPRRTGCSFGRVEVRTRRRPTPFRGGVRAVRLVRCTVAGAQFEIRNPGRTRLCERNPTLPSLARRSPSYQRFLTAVGRTRHTVVLYRGELLPTMVPAWLYRRKPSPERGRQYLRQTTTYSICNGY